MKKKRFSFHKTFLKKLKWSYIGIFLAVFLLTFYSYFLLIKHSVVDETMLYSWAWIVNYLNMKLFFSLLIVIFFISIFFARIDFKFKEKHFLVFIFILAFLLSSLTWSSPSPNPDVAEFFGVAKYIEVNGLIDYFKSFGTNDLQGYRFHSLLPIIGLAFIFFGESALVVHIITSVLFAFIPVLTFLLSRKLFSKRIAVIAAFLTLSIPNMLIQSSMFMVDVPTVFFVLLALFTFYVFLHKKKIVYYPLTVLTLLFAITSKRPAVLFLILSLPVLFIIVKNSNGFKLKHLSMKAFVIFYSLFVLLFVFVFLKLNFFSEQFAQDLSQANIVSTPAHYVNPYSYFFQFQPLIIVLFLISIIFFVLKPKLSYLFLFVWIFFPYIFIHDTTFRYMLSAFPAIAIAASCVLAKFKKQIVTFVVTIIFLSSALSILMGYIPLLKNEFYDNNIKLAADYVDEFKDVETVGVYMHYKDISYKSSPKTEVYGYVFDYYSNKRVYYDVSESVKNVYYEGLSRFNVFDYYKDKNHLTPDYDGVVVFSDVGDWQTIDYFDIKILKETLDKNYHLDRTFSIGKSGIEQNKFGFVYKKN